MSETKEISGHTPTPWRLEKGKLHYKGYWVVVADGMSAQSPLARLADWDDPASKADADLIVTAVNERSALLKCEEALRSLRLQALQSSVNDPANEWGMEALDLANAALSLLDEARK